MIHKVWALNLQILDTIKKQQIQLESPDTRYTWFQEPVKFEDALGRIFPVPSEYKSGVSKRTTEQITTTILILV